MTSQSESSGDRRARRRVRGASSVVFRRVRAPDGRMWSVWSDPGWIFYDSWAVLLPTPVDLVVMALLGRRRGWSRVLAESSDGDQQVMTVRANVPLDAAVEQAAELIRRGVALPSRMG